MSHEYKLHFTEKAEEELRSLESDRSQLKNFKAVGKCLYFMQTNLRHHSLQTHKYDEIEGPNGEDVFESYAQNKTPGAYRVFWFYGPKKGEITILKISPHP